MSTQAILDQVNNLLTQHKALSDLGEFLGSIASLEQLESETTARVKAVQDAATQAEIALVSATARLNAAHDAIALAEQAADSTTREAGDAATRIVSDANAKAIQIVLDAEQQAQTILSSTDSAREILDNLTVLVATKRGELADLVSRLADLKKQASSLAQ